MKQIIAYLPVQDNGCVAPYRFQLRKNKIPAYHLNDGERCTKVIIREVIPERELRKMAERKRKLEARRHIY